MQDYEEITIQESDETAAMRELIDGVYSLLSGYEGYDLEEDGYSVSGSDDGEIVIMTVEDNAYVFTGLSAGEAVSKAARIFEGIEEAAMTAKTAMSCIIEHQARKRGVDPLFEAALALCEGRGSDEADAIPVEDEADEDDSDGEAEELPEEDDDADELVEEADEDDAAEAGDEANNIDAPQLNLNPAPAELSWAGEDGAPDEEAIDLEAVDDDSEVASASDDPIGRLIHGFRKGGE